MEFEAVEQNLRHSFRVLASGRPTGDVRESGGVAIASAGAAFQMFNAAFLAAPVRAHEDDLERRIAIAQVHFRARGLPWAFWLCEDLLEGKARRRVARAFERFGLFRAAEMPGMLAEQVTPAQRPLPEIEIRRVSDEATRLAFCDVGSVCFHVPLSWFREIFLWEPAWRTGFTGYVGYVGSEPLATAATVATPEAIGVYNVATLPAQRGRGYGEALMRHALEEARRHTGCERTILQSTEDGYTLYLRMGYRPVTKVAVYASEG